MAQELFINGTVIDPESDELIADAAVTLKTKETNEQVATTTTAEDGTFAFEDLEAEVYKLIIVKEGYDDEYLNADLTAGPKEFGAIYPTIEWQHPYTRK